MTLVALILLPLLVSPALSIPIDFASALNYGYDYPISSYGGLGSGLSGLNAGWPLDRYGPVLASDFLDVAANSVALGADSYPRLPIDYGYPGYPKTVDYARENFVRASPYGSTEAGIRDEVTVRPSILRSPYSRFYSSYYPFNYYRGINRFDYDLPFRRTFPFGGLNLPRSSVLGRIAGDTMYLK